MSTRGGKKIKKIDYKRRQYRNPFFDHRAASRQPAASPWFSWKTKLLCLLLSAGLGAAGWAAAWSPWLAVTDLAVTVPDKIDQNEVSALVWQQAGSRRFGLIPQRNLPLLDTKNLRTNLESKYVLGGLEIKRRWPHRLEVKLLAKDYHFAWQENGAYYLVNRYDYRAAPSNEEEAKSRGLPIIDNLGQPCVVDGRLQSEQDKAAAIINISDRIKSKSDRLGISRFEVNNQSAASFQAVTAGPRLIFNIREDFDRQLVKYETVLAQGQKNGLAQKKYIDLRFGDKVYYQ